MEFVSLRKSKIGGDKMLYRRVAGRSDILFCSLGNKKEDESGDSC